MFPTNYENFWDLLKDADFARGFLTQCYHEGFSIHGIRHPDEIEDMPCTLVVELSRQILPFYYMEKTPSPNYWFH
jgi:hypothetical protein